MRTLPVGSSSILIYAAAVDLLEAPHNAGRRHADEGMIFSAPEGFQ